MLKSAIFFFIALLFLSHNTNAQKLTGTWELTHVAPVDVMDSEPKGVTNIRFHFTDDGKLYSLSPEDSSLNNLEYVHYRFTNDTLSVLPDGEEPIALSLFFPDSITFSFSRDFAPVRTYKKISNTPDVLYPIEPRSLQLINMGDTANYSVSYDENDYSALSFTERLKGTWEVIAYENISHGDMPPYGFLNDIWKFNKDTISVFSRIDQQYINVKYIPANGNIIVTPEDGSTQVMKADFNRWGHLVLQGENETIKLKLVSKNFSITVTPLKVVLLKLKGE